MGLRIAERGIKRNKEEREREKDGRRGRRFGDTGNNYQENHCQAADSLLAQF